MAWVFLAVQRAQSPLAKYRAKYGKQPPPIEEEKK
jgi:hypothetical protein